MNNKKDISDKNEKNNTDMSFKNPYKNNIFDESILELKDKEMIRFLQKKSERLAAAIYVITDLFPSHEPLRWELRRSVIELVFSSDRFKDTISSGIHAESKKKEQHLFELVSFWNLSYYAGYLSEGNFSLLKQELFYLLWILASRKSSSNRTSIFPRDFFSVEKNMMENSKSGDVHLEESFSGHFDKGHFWDTDEAFFRELRRLQNTQGQRSENMFGRAEGVGSSFGLKDTGSTEASRGSAEKKADAKPEAFQNASRKIKPISHIQVPSGTSSVRGKVLSKEISPRREAIVNFIKKEGDVSVKDVSKVIRGLSEKTLQRELTALVSDGVLKKEGERRWSRYSLRS
ncbi:MAG TPA: hypothetical protein VFM02_00735 [Candidatus Paceibacterota bacterium]|nr:hypothetical protein [Candidatus Paceibacterota bacterium]